jgi:hypothetical protein
LEDPRDLTRLYARLPLDDAAASTSGDYRQAIVFEGQRFSHIIDPRTGAPIRHECVAVSVLAADAFTADGWATALLVLGPEEGLRLAEANGLAASFVVRSPAAAPHLSTAAVPLFELIDVPGSSGTKPVAWSLAGMAFVLIVAAIIAVVAYAPWRRRASQATASVVTIDLPRKAQQLER